MRAVEFYLICLITGLSLSVLSFVLGASHLHLHGPRSLGHIHHVGHGHAGHGGHVGHAHHGVTPLNFATLMIFLAWFGGTGAYLSGHGNASSPVALVLSVLSGLVGAALVFLFLVKVLLPHDASMRPADYELPGTLATISLGIRAGGTGGITYAQGGARKTAAARAEEGAVLAKGVEVVIVRFEQGIAYVRGFDELAGISTAPGADDHSSIEH